MGQQAFSAPLPGLTAASTDETKSTVVPLQGLSQLGGTLQWGLGCTAGRVVFEIAPSEAYAGVWEEKFASDFVADGVAAGFGTPPCAQSFTVPGPFSGFGRWRITDAIVGGSVTTDTTGLVG